MRLFKQRNDNYIFPEVYRTIFFDIRISLFYIVIIRRISLYLSVFQFIRYRTFFHRVYASNIVKDKSAKNQEQYPFLRYEFFPFSDFSPVRFSEWKEAYQSCTITPPPPPRQKSTIAPTSFYFRGNLQIFNSFLRKLSMRLVASLRFSSLYKVLPKSVQRASKDRTSKERTKSKNRIINKRSLLWIITWL